MGTNWLNDLTHPIKLLVAAMAALWANLPAVYITLVLISLADILSGVLAASYAQTLSSQVSWRGMVKKAMMFLLVGAAAVLDSYPAIAAFGGPPLGQLLAGYFIASEALSLIENAAAVGVPIPKFLREALAKLNGKDKE